MSSTTLLFLSILGLLILTRTEAAAVTYVNHRCPSTTTFISHKVNLDPDSFQYNLHQLLNNLSSKANYDTDFYNTTAGKTSTEKAYGLFLCRGDIVGTKICKDCVVNATMDAVQLCPTEKEVVIWYKECMVRYSNQSFFSSAMSTFESYWCTEGEVVKNPTRFNQVLASSMDKVATDAAYDIHKFATNEVNVTASISVYSLGQCTQDLSTADCHKCLQRAIERLPKCCSGSKGAQILYPSCNVWYDVYRFWHNSTAAPAPAPAALPAPPPISVARPKGAGRAKLVSYIIVGATIFAVCVVLGYCFLRRRVRKNKCNAAQQQENDAKDIKTVESLQFDLGTIETATNKFSENNKLGEGGFGEVFKGTLDNGQVIAVKRLSKSSKQGVQEFKNEVALVAKLQHRNLVRLLGFCLQGEETILVYENLPNKSLDYFLFEPTKREQLDWLRRCMIIGGIARGILYLHEDSRLRVIHRDLKASNILLDGDMNPKISDFGMAKMFGVDDQIQGNTERIVGTYGYMAPEYAMEGLYSVKSDVFSFGILLLEIITGRKNFLGFHFTNCSPTLLAYAWQLWNEGNVLELIDPLLKDSCSPNEFLRYIHIGLLCVQEDANNRPTMSSVVLMLKTETIELSKPERPAFIFSGRSCTTYHHDDQIGVHGGHTASTNGMTISDLGPR